MRDPLRSGKDDAIIDLTLLQLNTARAIVELEKQDKYSNDPVSRPLTACDNVRYSHIAEQQG